MKKTEQAAAVMEAKNGDKKAFEQLYSDYRDRLYFFVLKNIGSKEPAEDIVSETFLDAMQNIGSLRAGEAFGSWLYSIAYRKCIRHNEDNSRTAHFDSEEEQELAISDHGLNEPIQLPEDYALNRDRQEQLKAIINSLSPEQRSAVILYYYNEQSLSEVAETLGISESAAGKRLFDARRKIKARIEKLIKSGAFCVAPLGALLESSIDGKYAAGAVKAGAAVKSISAIKTAAVSAAAVVAVGIPIGLYGLKGGWGGDARTENSSLYKANDPERSVISIDSGIADVFQSKDHSMTVTYLGETLDIDYNDVMTIIEELTSDDSFRSLAVQTIFSENDMKNSMKNGFYLEIRYAGPTAISFSGEDVNVESIHIAQKNNDFKSSYISFDGGSCYSFPESYINRITALADSSDTNVSTDKQCIFTAGFLEYLTSSMTFRDSDETWYTIEGDELTEVKEMLSKIEGVPCDGPGLSGGYVFDIDMAEEISMVHSLIMTGNYVCFDGVMYKNDEPDKVRELVEYFRKNGKITAASEDSDGTMAEFELVQYNKNTRSGYAVNETYGLVSFGVPEKNADDIEKYGTPHPGLVLDITWSGDISESYPVGLDSVTVVSVVDEREDFVSKHLNDVVIACILAEQQDIQAVVDKLTDLNAAEKEGLIWLAENQFYNIDTIRDVCLRVLSSLGYQYGTNDGLPEYSLTADDGTVYQINLSSKWVWKGNNYEAAISDDLAQLLYRYKDEIGLQPVNWN
ncbi:MAG: RNA polymerase sigma factor [Ruminococcus sp.]|nr:RNA polymerase sigma factor [Ruminococcus sp.]